MKLELTNKLKTIRQDYSKYQLSESSVDTNPLKQFSEWLHQAFEDGEEIANAFVLSTVNQFNQPSSRVLLLRDISHGGFTFFTNYESSKGVDMEGNKSVAMLFFWKSLQRQVRVEGTVSFLSNEESNLYFKSRPRESQLAAIASQQSKLIVDRKTLESSFQKVTKQYENKDIPKPEHWGGYVLKPTQIEFWQGRESRLHDRLKYTLKKTDWTIERLAP